MQAVVKMGSSQYLITEGSELLVEHPTVDGVLMVIDQDQIEVGTPTVSGVIVNLKTLGEERGKKVRVFKYKAKSRYRKVRGFRSDLTRIRIESIVREGESPSAPKKTRKTRETNSR